MALIPCPECGAQVSDAAHTCPSCGVSLVVGQKQLTNTQYVWLFVYIALAGTVASVFFKLIN